MGLSSFNLHRRRMVEEDNAKREKSRADFVSSVRESGVGEAIGGRLYDAGYRSRGDIAAATPEELQEIEGLGEERANLLSSWAVGSNRNPDLSNDPEAPEGEGGEPEAGEEAKVLPPQHRVEPSWDEMSVAELDEYARANYPDEHVTGRKADKIKSLQKLHKKAEK